MKKEYVKPQILFCDFELSQSIATGCELITNHADWVCPVYVTGAGWEDIVIFNTSDPSSMCSADPSFVGDSVCYHVPSDSFNVYTS